MKRILFCLALCASIASAAPWRTAYFFNLGSLSVANAPFSKYTHVIDYAAQPTSSCGIDDTGYQINLNYSQFVSAVHAAGAKALIDIFNDSGGTNMLNCTNSTNLSGFVSALVNYAKTHGYDGIDFDWENGVNETQYGNLISAVRSAWPTAVLTIGALITDRTMLAAQASNLDQINMQNYDSDMGGLSGNWSTVTRYNHMLHNSTDSDANTVDAFSGFMTGAGVPAAKLGVGIPFYGLVKQGQQSNCSSYIDGPEQAYCSGDATTNPRSSINFNDLMNSVYWSSGTKIVDNNFGAQYIKYDNAASSAFVPYTGPEQMQMDVSYINSKGFGGIMIFELSAEYVSSASGDARYPLSSALYNAMIPVTKVCH